MTRLDERDDWRTRAACTLDTAALFAPPEGKDYDLTAKRIDEAREFCRRGCPVLADCLAYGKAKRLDGVFGGELLSVGRVQSYEPQHRIELVDDVCGTPRGYSRHRSRKEEPCSACKHAHAINEANKRNHRRGAA